MGSSPGLPIRRQTCSMSLTRLCGGLGGRHRIDNWRGPLVAGCARRRSTAVSKSDIAWHFTGIYTLKNNPLFYGSIFGPRVVNSYNMGNNFKVAFRRLSRDKTFTLLNLAGLAIGIAGALQVYAIISYELGIDRFHHKADRIYRVVSTETYRNGLVDYDGCAPIPLPKAFRGTSPR